MFFNCSKRSSIARTNAKSKKSSGQGLVDVSAIRHLQLESAFCSFRKFDWTIPVRLEAENTLQEAPSSPSHCRNDGRVLPGTPQRGICCPVPKARGEAFAQAPVTPDQWRA